MHAPRLTRLRPGATLLALGDEPLPGARLARAAAHGTRRPSPRVPGPAAPRPGLVPQPARATVGGPGREPAALDRLPGHRLPGVPRASGCDGVRVRVRE